MVFCAPLEEEGCYCIDGYIRDNDDNFKCVDARDCKKDYFNYYNRTAEN